MHQGWWSASLGDGMLAGDACARIKDAWYRARAVAGGTPAMAVFTSWSAGDLHCTVTAYFTPACAELAARFDAVPCAAPARGSLELLAGEAGCWEAVFAPQ